jgi:phosphatidylinositol 4-kinase
MCSILRYLDPLCQGTTESSPWKLTKEFIEVLGGTDSTYYDQYKHRCIQTFIKLRKHVQDSIKFIEMMELNSTFASFR